MGNKTAKLSNKEVTALTSQTNWTADDLKALHVDFIKTDADKSGELDFDEFCTLFKTRIPMDEEGYRNLFNQMDADGGGTVSFQELATSLSVIGKGSTDDKLSFTFDLYDADGSGDLDKEECRNLLNQMKRVAASLDRNADDFIEAMLVKLDADGDGTITKKEWMEVGAQTPSLLVLLGVRKI
mmetsp:Transcript_124043/g.175000  ORF Transcript_124043/g.175000 Transcript_124043/m.175000 type:complete len:183 (-) Transcript_124043:44-592(-)